MGRPLHRGGFKWGPSAWCARWRGRRAEGAPRGAEGQGGNGRRGALSSERGKARRKAPGGWPFRQKERPFRRPWVGRQGASRGRSTEGAHERQSQAASRDCAWTPKHGGHVQASSTSTQVSKIPLATAWRTRGRASERSLSSWLLAGPGAKGRRPGNSHKEPPARRRGTATRQLHRARHKRWLRGSRPSALLGSRLHPASR